MITLSLFYYIYLALVFFFVIFSLFNIYHLIRFGFLSSINIMIIIVYVLVAIILLATSFYVLRGVNWDQSLINFDQFKIENSLNSNSNSIFR